MSKADKKSLETEDATTVIIPPHTPSAGVVTAEQHAEELKTPDWLFASTKAYHRWPHGKEVTRAEYEAAVEKANGATMHSGPHRTQK